MDEKGFAFTPLSYLLIIPVLIVAISYGNIINEANFIGNMIIGGDVTYTSATTIISAMQKSAGDAGRNAAYNASRKVIDSNTTFFESRQSKPYITNNIISALNNQIVKTAVEVKQQTGRQVYINNVLIEDYTDTPFNTNNVNITQSEPFGFTVNIKGGIPIKIVQNNSDQAYQFKTPEISTYVTLVGIEDPYIWIKTKHRFSNVIYNYPYYTYSDVYGPNWSFDAVVGGDNKLHYLWECLNGTNNTGNITPRPYYFPDRNGLSFFDRLEGQDTSLESNPDVRMSTFIIGDPLIDIHGNAAISRLDHEYIRGLPGSVITIGGSNITDPLGGVFYLSNSYKTQFGLENAYG